MAPAVPFALLGVVQLLAVAGWIGLAGAAMFPRLRRRVTPAFVLGALVMAAADVVTAVRVDTASSSGLGWARVGGLLLLGLGALGGAGQSQVVGLPAGGVAAVVAPLGAPMLPSVAGAVAGGLAAAAAWVRGLRRGADRVLGAALAAAFALTGVAVALGAAAGHSSDAALAVLSARSAATLAIGIALVQLARTMLLGKLLGAILVGVVAMAAGAVGIVGTGVANAVQVQQSQRLLQVAQGEQQALGTLTDRAALYAQVVAQCPKQQQQCVQFLTLFSEQPDYFAVVVQPTGARVVAPTHSALSAASLLQLSGDPIVQAALKQGASPRSFSGGPVLLRGAKPTLALVAAVPGRPGGSSDARIKPTYAAVYGVGLVDAYLASIRRTTGYDVTVLAEGRALASSLDQRGRAQVVDAARRAHVEQLDPSADRVISAEGNAPTAAFVPVTPTDNGDVRVATLAISQPAGEALRAERSVLQRMFLTALIVLIAVSLLALALAQRIADPVRRLTVAAGRVRRGDLASPTSVRSRDEVGSLARAFDAMTASLRNVTGELRTTAAEEAALRTRLETVVESMSDGLVVTDDRGRITSVNRTAADLLGVDADDVVGRAVGDVVVVTDDEGRAMRATAADRGTVDGRLAVADGTHVPVRFGAAALADGQGRVFVLADRRREDEVERMKTEFLANVSHELRTPLTPIRGYAEMLLRRADLGRPQVETFLDEILSSTARMSRAVELLVDVAALEGGRIAPERGKVSVRGFVEERLETWRERYPERASDFKRRVSSKLPAVDIDAHWVGRALDELADNAVKYTPPGTPITLVAGPADDEREVRVAVRDAGPGFDPVRAAELVGDFSQLDASDTRRVGGMGLGLGFVSRVADRFDLAFGVDATVGAGAEFALLLPAWSGPPEPRAAGRSRAKPARARTAR